MKINWSVIVALPLTAVAFVTANRFMNRPQVASENDSMQIPANVGQTQSIPDLKCDFAQGQMDVFVQILKLKEDVLLIASDDASAWSMYSDQLADVGCQNVPINFKNSFEVYRSAVKNLKEAFKKCDDLTAKIRLIDAEIAKTQQAEQKANDEKKKRIWGKYGAAVVALLVQGVAARYGFSTCSTGSQVANVLAQDATHDYISKDVDLSGTVEDLIRQKCEMSQMAVTVLVTAKKDERQSYDMLKKIYKRNDGDVSAVNNHEIELFVQLYKGRVGKDGSGLALICEFLGVEPNSTIPSIDERLCIWDVLIEKDLDDGVIELSLNGYARNKETDHLSVLEKATRSGAMKVLQAMLDTHCYTVSQYRHALSDALRRGNIEVVILMMHAREIAENDDFAVEDNLTPFLLACRFSPNAVVKWMYEHNFAHLSDESLKLAAKNEDAEVMSFFKHLAPPVKMFKGSALDGSNKITLVNDSKYSVRLKFIRNKIDIGKLPETVLKAIGVKNNEVEKSVEINGGGKVGMGWLELDRGFYPGDHGYIQVEGYPRKKFYEFSIDNNFSVSLEQ